MSGLQHAMERIVEELPGLLRDLLPVLRDAARTVLFPVILAVVSCTMVVRILQVLYRIIFPPPCSQLHKEALAFLKKGDDAKTHREAKQLLRYAIRRDPTYIPCHLSLIAIELYQEQDHVTAMKSIQRAKELLAPTGDNKELKQMELDAKAMACNLSHMVLAGSFANTHLGDYSYRPLKT